MAIDIQEPARLPKDFVIFFCWQDHLDKKLHRYLIRDAIKAAIVKVQGELPKTANCILRPDSDTSGKAGTIEIAKIIFEKISKSTIVIGDVTPAPVILGKKRWYPNPNVMIEIGYAAKVVGWNRILCLFNGANCKAEQLPFDIRHRRVNPYICKDIKGKQQAVKKLEGIIVVSLRAFLEEIGRGEIDESLDNATLKHARDLRLLRQLMGTIHRPTMDRYIERGLSSHLYYDATFFFIGFDAVIGSSSFRFYDKQLQKFASELHEVWSDAVYYGSVVFFPGSMPNSFVLKEPHLWDEEYSKMFEAMGAAYNKLPDVLKAFLDYVHEHFPEIDMDETDKTAWQNNLPYIAGGRAQKKSRKVKNAPGKKETK